MHYVGCLARVLALMLFWAGIFCIAGWLGLAFFRHGFWRVDQLLDKTPKDLAKWPDVVAVIPARNEAEQIETVLKALLEQQYPGRFEIIVVNDSSTDDTAEIVKSINGARLVNAASLPDGWAGKMWALSEGLRQAEKLKPEYYWLSDADIYHEAGVLKALVGHAETRQTALTSQMVRLKCESFWEKLLVPAFIFYFALIYPFRAINNPASSIAGAAGGSILIKREALDAIGSIAAIKDALIDDCALGKEVKQKGYKIWLGFAEQSISLRGYETLAGFWAMVKRSAYTQLAYSPALLVAAMSGLAFSHLLPVILLFSGYFLLGLVAWAIMSFIYWPIVKFYHLSPLFAITLPLAASLFGAMTISSAWAHHFGGEKQWRGRDI